MSPNDSEPDKTDCSGLTRRRVLKGSGAVAGGLAFPFGQASAALSQGYDGERVLRTPSPENSIPPTEAFEIQRDAIQRFRSNTNIGEEVPLGSVLPSEDTEILALSYRIDGAGQPSVFIGVVPANQHVSKSRAARLHQKARNHAKSVQNEVDPERADHDVTTGVASANYATGWDEMVSDYAIQIDDCPYGSIYMGGEVYEKQGTSYYGYGVNHIHRNNPGANYCDSSWNVNDSYSRHRWDAFDRAEPILHEYYPDTDRDGDFSVDGSVGFSGASIGVSYNPPDVYRDVTAGWNGTENVEWDWDYTWDPDTPAQHEPASVIKSPEQAVSGTYASNRLLEIIGHATWSSTWYGNHDTDYSAYIYVE